MNLASSSPMVVTVSNPFTLWVLLPLIMAV